MTYNIQICIFASNALPHKKVPFTFAGIYLYFAFTHMYAYLPETFRSIMFLATSSSFGQLLAG